MTPGPEKSTSRRALAVAFALGAGLALGACEEDPPPENAKEELEDAAEEAGDAVEEAADNLEEELDQ